MSISGPTRLYTAVMLVLTPSLVLPTSDFGQPFEGMLAVLGVVALAGALPSLILAGVPLYMVGNIAMGDPFFLSGSALIFGVACVMSVLVNAALLERLVRRRTARKEGHADLFIESRG